MKIAVRSFNGVRSDASDWNQIAEFAKEAESLGADSIWTSEAWGTDAITPWLIWRLPQQRYVWVRGLFRSVVEPQVIW